MRTTVSLVSLLSLLPSFAFSSPLEVNPRDPENGCIALCGCCPCPCPESRPPPSSKSLTPPPPLSTSSPPPTTVSGAQATPSDFTTGEQPYNVNANSTDPTTQNLIRTWLYGYDGCAAKNPAYRGNIDEAYYDSWTMANVAGVKSDINWNEAVCCLPEHL